MVANPLDRAERRRAARHALRAALAGLDPADKLALLEDELADMYTPRAAIAAVQPSPGVSLFDRVPPLPPQETPPVPTPRPQPTTRGDSVAQRIFAVMTPGRTYSVQDVAGVLPGIDIQQIRSELNRQSRNGRSLDHPSHGQYRLRAANGQAVKAGSIDVEALNKIAKSATT